MKPIVYIVHGYGADANSNFFLWLKKKLNEIDIDCESLNLPNTNNPKLNEWLNTLNKAIDINKDVYIVAHSLGCITTLKYIEQLNPETKIKGVILVSGFDERLPLFPILDSFVEKPIDFNNVNNKCLKFEVIASQDDELVPFEYSYDLSKRLKANFKQLNGYGHFLVFELPIAFEILYKWIKGNE